ncbi:MAG: ribonuclease Z [Lachnospiraceae bacterium]|nr:ribonuclease Z [Lachnospiraceae bacterium]
MLDICLLGTGGMMPLPGRWLTACYTKFNGSALLIDCGEGTQVALRLAGLSCHDIDVIAITHFHGDHISGITGMLLSMGNADRVAPVTIVGPKGIERVVKALRIIAPELPFELKFVEIENTDEPIELFGYYLKPFKLNHGIECYGYSQIIKRAGRFMPEKAAENDVPMKAWSRLQKGMVVEEDGRVFTPDMILGPERKGIKLTYCTDTRPTKSIAENAAGSDLFICEGMYGEPGSEEKARAHRHMTYAEAATIAKNAGAREMWLTHFSPSLVRPKEYAQTAKSIFPNTVIPKDGFKKTLRFEED